MDGHLLAFAAVFDIAVALVHKLVQGEAPPHQSACLSVLAEDQIFQVQGGRAAYVKLCK